MIDKAKRVMYSLSNIPVGLMNQKLEDYLKGDKLKKLKAKLRDPPKSGVVLVSGTAGPIINELYDSMPFYGVDFIDYYQKQFTEAKADIPQKDFHYYVYNVGMEPVKNFEYSSRLLESFLATHSDKLIIIETPLTPTTFESTYMMSIPNKVIIKPKKEETWL